MNLTDKIHKRLRPYAKTRGLLRKGRTYYTITEDTAYCFSIENHSFNVYVHFYLIPPVYAGGKSYTDLRKPAEFSVFQKNTHIAEDGFGGRN